MRHAAECKAWVVLVAQSIAVDIVLVLTHCKGRAPQDALTLPSVRFIRRFNL